LETRRREWREMMGVIGVVGEAYGAEGSVKVESRRGHRWRPEDFACYHDMWLGSRHTTG